MAINEETLKESISKASEILKNTAKEIESITFPGAETIVFATEQLTDDYIAELLKNVPANCANTDFIYVLELESSEVSRSISESFVKSRKSQGKSDFAGKKDFCKCNNNSSNYLYVGRSKKLRSRLKQHLGAGNKGVYAIHMSRWIAGISASINIHYYGFDGKDNLIIQAIEDALWEQFQPMFGRKGEK